MLAYRHAFHAGNHADVLKHLVLVQVLKHMAAKDKPFTYVDTHAGAGGYALDSRYARQHEEAADGIAALYDATDAPAAVAEYLAEVRAFNGGGPLEQYPGSPGFAAQRLRADDRMRLYELHPTDCRILESYLASRPQTQVMQSDGFAALKAELPPPSRRGLVLIDPPYELKADYDRTLAAVREALQRFAQGVLLIWVPQLRTVQSERLPQRLLASVDQSAARGWLHARLTVSQGGERGFGLIGSHLVVVNPPFGLEPALREALPWLVERLGRFEGAGHLLEQRLP
ncbi:23S rRNA (adenine(2030)-N(6))-methyltransferase RlmJ [Aquabacterium sp. J223]|uniref:23S rRNA (adenine(2030)-N(6))-methyltransferase RlmJ n=1 Tax=Aquabacterium sp. J223 TaxID=2898431 RepID=UPI0021ADED31|nr:23S rRNA (adenine(2030)-N(6))-methyltransferase RlmJ [Aquabacterium sp. J223]UUX96112.1 23S rRNA (adenine(2030)-N(6))-methyltransferase RlmJ [Aquabacterium sp. J223]